MLRNDDIKAKIIEVGFTTKFLRALLFFSSESRLFPSNILYTLLLILNLRINAIYFSLRTRGGDGGLNPTLIFFAFYKKKPVGIPYLKILCITFSWYMGVGGAVRSPAAGEV